MGIGGRMLVWVSSTESASEGLVSHGGVHGIMIVCASYVCMYVCMFLVRQRIGLHFYFLKENGHQAVSAWRPTGRDSSSLD